MVAPEFEDLVKKDGGEDGDTEMDDGLVDYWVAGHPKVRRILEPILKLATRLLENVANGPFVRFPTFYAEDLWLKVCSLGQFSLGIALRSIRAEYQKRIRRRLLMRRTAIWVVDCVRFGRTMLPVSGASRRLTRRKIKSTT